MKTFVLAAVVASFVASITSSAYAFGSAQAEEPQGTQVGQREAFQNATTDWDSSLFQSLQKDRNVVVLEKAAPQKRRACRVREVRPDELVCSSKFHHDRVFGRKDLLAVIEPRDLGGRVFAITASVAGGLIAAGFFAGPAAPVLWAVGGFAVLALGAEAIGDNGPVHDSVLYFAPGPQPSLPLR